MLSFVVRSLFIFLPFFFLSCISTWCVVKRTDAKMSGDLPPSFVTMPPLMASDKRSTGRSEKCRACNRKIITRRNMLQQCAIAAFSFMSILTRSPDESAAKDGDALQSDELCKNCAGSGKVTCELCLGTGFWRAISGNDPNQKYKGVVCPECEGTGNLICPICLGTGEGNIKGLLRRRAVQPGPGRILQS